MPDKELSYRDSALLFINTLQTELAKQHTSESVQSSESKAQRMPPPTPQIRHLQKSKAESQGGSQDENSIAYADRTKGSKKAQRQ